MTISIEGKMRLAANWRRYVSVIAMLLVAFSIPTFASLGDTVDSVTLDQTQMSATVKVTEKGSYSVYELTAPTGTVVREYVAAGIVFGVGWQGPFVPDMRQILSSYFDSYSQAANAQRESRVGRQPLNIQQPGLVVRTAGHMRDYYGRAYVPALLPSGVSPDDVR